MIVRPSSSYELQLPDDILSDVDGRVVSFWVRDSPLLLQLSSYIRIDGPQVAAATRMAERIQKNYIVGQRLATSFCKDADEAIFEEWDRENIRLHCYFVWPHLTIYATVVGPTLQMQASEKWANDALRTLQLTKQRVCYGSTAT